MKNRIFISVSDQTSLKQYNLHKIVKKFVFYCLVGIFVLMSVGFVLMSFLMKQVQEISQVKMDLMEKYRSIYMQNQALKNQIKEKSLELIDVSKKVSDLEEIIDFSKNREKLLQNEPITAELNRQDQLFLLQILPNGNPIKQDAKIVSSAERIHPLKGKYGVHSGIDYLVASGTPVYATADGIVELSRERTTLKGYGRFVKMTHVYGFTSMYGHLSQVLVKKGEFVKKGQVIGYSGRSGESLGERLYYEIRFLGSYQDPFAFVQWGKENFESIFEKKSNIDWNRLFWAIQDLKQLQSYRLQERQE